MNILKKIKLTTLNLDEKNRMLRFGFGFNDGNFFIRLDLWIKGYRITFS